MWPACHVAANQEYATATFPINHLICPPKFRIGIFGTAVILTQDKSETKVMQNFAWQIRCIMRNVEVALYR